MKTILVRYPIFTLNRTILYSPGDTVTTDSLADLIDRRPETFPNVNLMDYRRIAADVNEAIDSSPHYTVVFGSGRRKRRLMELMSCVSLPLPILQTLDYFKSRDIYTYRHILMVYALSTMLAQDLTADYQSLIREAEAGPTHDIGKICVPIEILKKQTPLTTAQYTKLKHHTIAGYVLMSYYTGNFDKLVVRVARDHHERKNGTGYPFGVELEDLMVEIVVVSDIYDALVSKRPYRPISYDNRSALEEITRMAERGEVSWCVVKSLVANNRKERPHFTECHISFERRGHPPPKNSYGIIQENGDPETA